MNRVLSLLGSLLVSSVLAQSAPAAMPTPAALAAERELTQRALNQNFGPFGAQSRLFVPQLPAKLLAPLPAVPASCLLGSLTQTPNDAVNSSSQAVFYDSTASVAQIRSAFRSSLVALGWTPYGDRFDPANQGGFQPADDPANLAYYRLQELVTFNAQLERVNGVTRVSLRLFSAPGLKEQLRSQDGFSGSRSTLPALRAPEDAKVQPGGASGGGGGNWSTSAVIQSTLSVQALSEFYAAQLQTARWTKLNSAVSGKVLTSIWKFSTPDFKSLTGILVLREDAPGRYSAQLASLGFQN